MKPWRKEAEMSRRKWEKQGDEEDYNVCFDSLCFLCHSLLHVWGITKNCMWRRLGVLGRDKGKRLKSEEKSDNTSISHSDSELCVRVPHLECSSPVALLMLSVLCFIFSDSAGCFRVQLCAFSVANIQCLFVDLYFLHKWPDLFPNVLLSNSFFSCMT